MVKIQPKTLFVGKNILYLPTCHSTNEIARQKIQNEEFINGTVIYTDYQTNGKGLRGNHWESVATENLLMSLIINPEFIKVEDQFLLNILTANSIHQLLTTLGFENVTIKWPNDIYINDKKVAGVLIEGSISGNKLGPMVIGIGLNIYQKIFNNEKASSLLAENKDFTLSRNQIIEQFCEIFESGFNKFQALGKPYLLNYYLENLFGINQKRKFLVNNIEIFGIISGIDNFGRLELISENEKKYYDLKEIKYLFE